MQTGTEGPEAGFVTALSRPRKGTDLQPRLAELLVNLAVARGQYPRGSSTSRPKRQRFVLP